MAAAAKHYSVPLIVLGAAYKLTPKFIPGTRQPVSIRDIRFTRDIWLVLETFGLLETSG